MTKRAFAYKLVGKKINRNIRKRININGRLLYPQRRQQKGASMNQEKTENRIPFVTKPVSRIFFGTAIDPLLAGQDQDELLDAVIESGINTLDMARNYQKAETVVGRWMKKRGCRDQLVLLSKCGHPTAFGRKRVSERDIREDYEKTAEALGTSYIDIYLLHRDDPDVPVGEIVELFNAMHQEGKIGAFGGSNWTYQRISEANAYAKAHNIIPFSVSSPNFGLAEQVEDLWGGGCVSISGPEQAEARAWYRKENMPIVAYSSLGRGLFSGRVTYQERDKASKVMDKFAMKGYACPQNFERLRRCEILAEKKGVSVSQIALRWIFTQDLNTYAVIGTGNPSRMTQNLNALNIPMTKEEAEYLNLEREGLQ